MTSLKDRWTGQRKMFKYYFSKKSLRFYNGSTKENATYTWKKYLTKDEQMKGFKKWTEEAPF